MNIEYEATFKNIDKDAIRKRLQEVGAELKRKEFMQKRAVYHFPKGNHVKGGWMRIRDEGDKITMSVKVIDGDAIENQKEACLAIDSFNEAEILLSTIGCERKAYQETLRELWVLDGVEVTIDTWPFLEPFVEVEGENEEVVKNVSERLGFDWGEAIFGGVDVLYAKKYNISTDRINNETPKIVFDMENPFLS